MSYRSACVPQCCAFSPILVNHFQMKHLMSELNWQSINVIYKSMA